MRITIDNGTHYRGRNSRPNYPVLCASLAVALLAGMLAALVSPRFSPESAQWYAALAKPPWMPPAALFGPVWVLLYALMACAVWLVWRERYHGARPAALAAYALQLLLNALWAPLFFGSHNIGAGLFICVALALAILWTMREFLKVRRAAGWMLLPYLAWAAIATAMNLSVWERNV